MRAASIYGTYLALAVLAAAVCGRTGWWRRRPRFCWAACVAVSVAGSLFLARVSDPLEWFSDFNKAYYPAGRQILEEPAALYAPPALTFVNLPILALGFTPLSYLPLPWAQGCFTALGAAAVVASWWLLARLTESVGRRRAVLLTAFALDGPLWYSIREGNLTHFVLLLLVAAAWCVSRRRDFCLGALLALAALIKLPLGLLPVYYCLRGRWRVAAGAGLTGLAAFGLSLALFGADAHQRWFDDSIRPFLGKAVAAYNIQSLSGFLARLLTDASLGSWMPCEAGLTFKALHNGLVGLLAAATLWTCWRAGTPPTADAELIELGAVLCLALVVSPVSWTHYYLLLLLPLGLYLLRTPAPSAGMSRACVWLAALMVSAPVVAPPPLPLGRLAASHYVAGGVLLLGMLLAARRRGAGDAARAKGRTAEGERERKRQTVAARPVSLSPRLPFSPSPVLSVPRSPRAGPTTAAAYLVLALLISAVWTYYARTELDVEKLDAVTPSGEVLSTKWSSIVRLASGRAFAPFVKRRLLVDLARGMARAVPRRTWDGVCGWLEGDGRLARQARAQLDRLGWRPADYPLLLSAHLLIYLAVVGFLFTCRWLVVLLYDCTTRVADVTGGVVGLALLGGVGGGHYCAYPYDLPNAFLFALALAALVARRWWFVPVFAAAAYSKETALLLIPAYALLAEERGSPRFWGTLAVLAALFAGERWWVGARYPAPDPGFWFPGRNARLLACRFFYLWFAPFLLVGMVRAAAAWRHYPPALRRLSVLAVPLLGMAFFKGWIEELRQYLELLPVYGLILCQWLLYEAGAGAILPVRAASPQPPLPGTRPLTLRSPAAQRQGPDTLARDAA